MGWERKRILVSTLPRVAVIGAGITGAACASRLKAQGVQVQVFDKGRSVGGRMASRRITLPDGTVTHLDHGAQFASARDTETLEAFKGVGAVAWYRDRMVGTPSIRAIPEALLKGISVSLETEIAAVSETQSDVTLTDTASQLLGAFDHVVCTVPVPQACKLIPKAAESLEDVVIAPCWALMLVFESRWAVDGDLFTGDESLEPFSWIARDSAKPGRDPLPDRWIAHADPGWSRTHLEESKEQVASQLLEALRTLSPEPMPPTISIAAHRWRYARTETALGQPYIAFPRNRIILAGDWCLGARVEAGYRSGNLAASYLLDQLA